MVRHKHWINFEILTLVCKTVGAQANDCPMNVVASLFQHPVIHVNPFHPCCSSRICALMVLLLISAPELSPWTCGWCSPTHCHRNIHIRVKLLSSQATAFSPSYPTPHTQGNSGRIQAVMSFEQSSHGHPKHWPSNVVLYQSLLVKLHQLILPSLSCKLAFFLSPLSIRSLRSLKKKYSAIAAIIWKHYRNDCSDRSNRDRWDRTLVYLGDRSDREI